MSQIILFRDNNFTKPYFQCERCRVPVEDCGSALLCWDADDSSRPWIRCEDCDDGLTLDGNDRCFTMELDVALAHLLGNSKFNQASAEEKVRIMAEVGL